MAKLESKNKTPAFTRPELVSYFEYVLGVLLNTVGSMNIILWDLSGTLKTLCIALPSLVNV